MSQIYGQLFISKFGIKDDGTWFETLKDLTPLALESGMQRLRQLTQDAKFVTFPPICLEFRAVCLAFYDDLKLPKAIDAYREIKNRAYLTTIIWSHPVVQYIASKLPGDFLEIRSERSAYEIFEKIYKEVILLVKQGHKLPIVKDNLALVKKANKEIAAFYLTEIKHKLRS
ncbi:MAG: hypothetical protein CK423_06755 [Legionella sp.]|nr:MAG: hypothetical protein CK423_06755 [Legionella sp.]